MARIYKPLDDKSCIAIYRANKGLDGKPVQSQKKLASEYSVAAGRIAASIRLGAELSSVDGVSEASKESVKGKTTTKVKASGVNGLTPDQIAEIHRLHNDEGISQSQIGRDLDIPRHKVRKALTVEVVQHANGVKAAGVEHIVELWDQSIGSTFTREIKEDAEKFTLIGLERTQKDDEEPVISGVVLVPTNTELKCAVEAMDTSFVVTKEELTAEENPVRYYPEGTDFNFSDPFVAFERAMRSKGDDCNLMMNDGTLITVDVASEYNDPIEVAVNSEFLDATGKAHIFTDINCDKTNDIFKGEAHGSFTAADTNTARIDHTQEKLLDNVSVDAPQCMVLPDQIMVVVDGEPKSLPKDHANFAPLAKAIKDGKWEDVYRLIDIQKAINQYSKGLLKVEKGTITFDGEAIKHDGFCKRMMTILQGGQENDVERLANFLEKVMENPSNNIVNRIFDFMKFADVEIADDGDIIAYKGVRGDYRDGHSGKISNAPGNVVTMRRNRVNEKQEQTCSYGLHVCSLSYLPQMSCFGGSSNKIVRVKLSPTDIVSIPTDYKDAKIRCCRYEVVEDVTSAYRSGTLKIDMEGVFSL
ncbi:RIIB lysis inhibitor [Vibrio phage K397]|nr:hypothetical protein MYOV002v2_p0165 [Vibrio phage 144E46.1]